MENAFYAQLILAANLARMGTTGTQDNAPTVLKYVKLAQMMGSAKHVNPALELPQTAAACLWIAIRPAKLA
jgi:hypothetical protein